VTQDVGECPLHLSVFDEYESLFAAFLNLVECLDRSRQTSRLPDVAIVGFGASDDRRRVFGV